MSAKEAPARTSSLLLFDRKDDDTENGSERGRHLVATQRIPKGRLIFCERPLVALQSLGNPVWVCHACQAFVGGPHSALHILANQSMPTAATTTDSSTDSSNADDDDDVESSSWKVVPCRHQCGQVFCSIECEADFYESRHKYLCTGRIGLEEERYENEAEHHPLIQYKQHAITTNEIFLLVAEYVVGEHSHRQQHHKVLKKQQSETKSESQQQSQFATELEDVFVTTNPYDDFCREPWWDIDSKQQGGGNDDIKVDEEEEATKNILKGLCEEAARCWNEHWSLLVAAQQKDNTGHDDNSGQRLPPIETTNITALHIAGIIGACELNSMGIRRRNPLCRNIFSQELRRQKKADILKCLEQAGMIDSKEEDDESSRDRDHDHDHNQNHVDNDESKSGDPPDQSKNDNDDKEEENKNDDDDDDDEEMEYTDDQIAEFFAGLDIYEDESAKKAMDTQQSTAAGEGVVTETTTDNPVNEETEEEQAPEFDDDCCDDDQDEHDHEHDHDHDEEGGDQDDLDILFSPLDGTAMYAITCKMNHSCEPNVAVLYKTRGWGAKHPLVAHIVAINDIEPGEELCISYIQESEPREQRQEELSHYGFACTCSKCEREKDNGGEVKDEVGANDEDLLFGSDDSDGVDGEDGEVGNANINAGHGPAEGTSSNDPQSAASTETLEKGEEALKESLTQLNAVLNNSTMGSIPLPFLAQASTFIIQTAITALVDLDKHVNISGELEQCVHALRERNFAQAKSVGASLKRHLFSMLKKDSKWPSTAYREAFWCATVAAAVGVAHECSFLVAISYLDEALILGLDRAAVGDFFAYVELHASQMTIGPCVPFNDSDSVPDYTSTYFSDLITTKGLSQPIQFPMPEYVDPDETMIQSDYFSKAKPVVIRQLAAKWPSIQKWRRLSFFCRYYGHRVVPIELGSMRDEFGMKEDLMTLRKFITTYLSVSSCREYWTLQDATSASQQNGIAYLAQHPLIQQLPGLGKDIDMGPSICGPLGPSHVYLWIGTGGTRTPLHFDSYSNLFVQLVGAKYVRIYAEEETPKLHVSKNESYGLQQNMSDVDCEREDFSRYPLASDAKYQEVLLFPGDSLFIPSRAWHYVRSLSTSISVNYWF